MEISNLENLCRTCMSASSGNNKSKQRLYCKLDFPSIMELLQSICPQIQICIEDKLPKIMCDDCIDQLEKTYEFLQMYKKTDEKFRKLLKECENLAAEPLEETPLEDAAKGIDNRRDIANIEIVMEKVEDDLSNHELHPEFEAMFIHSKTDEEVDEQTELPDNPFDETSSDNEEWITTEERKTRSRKRIKLKKCKSLRATKNKAKEGEKLANNEKEEHILPTANEDGSIDCPECEKVLNSLADWQDHNNTEHKGPERRRRRANGDRKPFECESCRKVFQRRSIYNSHLLTHTGNFHCLECGKKCRSYNSLNMHMLCHKGERFECKTCGKEFSNINDYNTHVLSHKDDQPLQCKECGKILKTTLGLSTHLLRHKGEKKFQCPHCPKTFVVRSGLYGHMKQIHEEGKPFLCDICGKSFRMADLLTKHKRYHSERNFHCEFCDKRFVTSDKQRRHMRIHTGEKPYRCKYCDRAYTQSNERNKHLKQHLGENIIQCELCPLRFPLVRDMRAHFVTHKDEDEATRARNLEARALEEKILKVKFGVS